MKRDMELIREILLEAERIVVPGGQQFPTLTVEGWDHAVVYEHARLLTSAGFLIAAYELSNAIPVRGITWEGYDLLDSIRDDSVWANVKKKIAEAGGSVPIDLLQPLATQFLRSKLGLPDG